MTNILWMRGGALGDFVLALPVLEALRDAFPAACIEAVGPRAWLPLAAGLASRLTALEDPCWDGLFGPQSLPERLQHCDLAILLRSDPEGELSRRLKDAGVRRLSAVAPHPPDGIHAIDHLLQALEAVGLRPPSDAVRSRAPGPGPSLRSLDRWQVNPVTPGRVLIHPGSGGNHKRWPSQHFVQLAQGLSTRGYAPEVVLGPVELEQGEADRWQSTGFDCLLAPPLLELSQRLTRAAGFVGNDSGIGHLAAVTGCPTLAIFGPTSPQCWAPRGPRVEVLLAPSPGGLTSLAAETVLDHAHRLFLMHGSMASPAPHEREGASNGSV